MSTFKDPCKLREAAKTIAGLKIFKDPCKHHCDLQQHCSMQTGGPGTKFVRTRVNVALEEKMVVIMQGQKAVS